MPAAKVETIVKMRAAEKRQREAERQAANQARLEELRALRWHPQAEHHFARRDRLAAVYADLPAGGHDQPPSVAERSMLNTATSWAQGLPAVWRPANIDLVALESLAVAGALRWGQLHRIEVAWDGEQLRCNDLCGLLRTLVEAEVSAAPEGGKGAIHSAGARVLALRAMAARVGLWAGQQNVANMWRANAAVIDVHGALDQTAPVSASGYDARQVGRAIDDGFSTTRQNIPKEGCPALELLALVGAEYLVRLGALRVRRGAIDLPRFGALPLRDVGDLRRWAQAADRWMRYDMGWSGKRRYLQDGVAL